MPLPVVFDRPQILLCHGCVKRVAITRDIISNGIMKKEEEVLTINVKPGWRKGTKIRFEGKGTEIAGNVGDVVFMVDEIQHPLFTRQGDDLEYGIEIPLKGPYRLLNFSPFSRR